MSAAPPAADVAAVDRLNTGLLLLSLGVALILPFHLFLVAYAVLGPLHYLTQLRWLHRRRYFIPSTAPRFALWLGAGLAVAAVAPAALGLQPPAGLQATVALCALAIAAAMSWAPSPRGLIGALGAGLAVAFLTADQPAVAFALTVLMPTVVHVWLFTLFFMLFGAFRANSAVGKLNAALLLTAPFVLAMASSVPYVSLAPSSLSVFVDGGFADLNVRLTAFLGLDAGDARTVRTVQAFLAFAYAYHYLNWFTKTSIIGWQAGLTRRSKRVLLGLWLVFSGIYAIDFSLGVATSFVLSVLHVYAELPLDMVALKGTVKRWLG